MAWSVLFVEKERLALAPPSNDGSLGEDQQQSSFPLQKPSSAMAQTNPIPREQGL